MLIYINVKVCDKTLTRMLIYINVKLCDKTLTGMLIYVNVKLTLVKILSGRFSVLLYNEKYQRGHAFYMF